MSNEELKTDQNKEEQLKNNSGTDKGEIDQTHEKSGNKADSSVVLELI